jgi:hypothetical protein
MVDCVPGEKLYKLHPTPPSLFPFVLLFPAYIKALVSLLRLLPLLLLLPPSSIHPTILSVKPTHNPPPPPCVRECRCFCSAAFKVAGRTCSLAGRTCSLAGRTCSLAGRYPAAATQQHLYRIRRNPECCCTYATAPMYPHTHRRRGG